MGLNVSELGSSVGVRPVRSVRAQAETSHVQEHSLAEAGERSARATMKRSMIDDSAHTRVNASEGAKGFRARAKATGSGLGSGRKLAIDERAWARTRRQGQSFAWAGLLPGLWG